MNQLTPIREEHVTDVKLWRASNSGVLQWEEMIEDQVNGRIDKLTYTTGDHIEHVLSVDSPYGTRMIYFAEDFSSAEGKAFLTQESLERLEMLQARRRQDIEQEAARRSKLAAMGNPLLKGSPSLLDIAFTPSMQHGMPGGLPTYSDLANALWWLAQRDGLGADLDPEEPETIDDLKSKLDVLHRAQIVHAL